MNRKYLKTFLRIIGTIAFIMIMLRVYYELKWVDLLMGIYNLEIKHKDIALVSNKSMMFITKSSVGEDTLNTEMSKYGWEFVNNYGSGYVFTNADEEILLKKKVYFIGYTTYEICNEESVTDGHKLFI